MLRALMLRKKISEAQKALEELRTIKGDFDTRSAELQKREDELAAAIEEASTEEEKAAVEEAVADFESDKAALENEQSENDQKIADLEGEVSEMERELEEIESQQRSKPVQEDQAAPVVAGDVKPTITERNTSKMFKTRTLNQMSDIQRAEFVAREDVKKTLAEVRTLIKEKRTVTGADVFIGVSIFELIRENVINYSKLYSRVRANFTKNNGRQPVEGAIPEAIWTEACASLSELDLSFGSVELDTYKVGGYFAICNAKLEDSDIDLLDVFTDALLQAIGFALDKAFVYGTGTKMPTGAVTAIASTASQLVTVSGSAHKDAFFAALIDAEVKADSSKSRGEKTWIVNKKTYATIRKEAIAVDGSGAYVSLVNGVMPILGGDIIVLEFVPDNNIVVGYFDLYSALIKKEMTVSTSTECKFIEDQTVIKGVMRADGKPAVEKAFVAIGLGEAPTTEVEFAGNPSQA